MEECGVVGMGRHRAAGEVGGGGRGDLDVRCSEESMGPLL